MKIRHTTGGLTEKIPIDMTPMIDIVFQLMAFFIMTLKVVVQEGDFNIKMPAPSSSQNATPPLLPAIAVRLEATAEGRLSAIYAGEVPLASSDELRDYIISIVGDPSGPNSLAKEQEVELDFDDNIRYEHVIGAVTAITGYRNSEGQVVPLIEKLKFAPPKELAPAQ